MASFDRLKDVGVEVGLGWQVGLGQRLLHPLDLHQTQSPVLSWGRQPTTHQQTNQNVRSTTGMDL